jgi:plastocyanin
LAALCAIALGATPPHSISRKTRSGHHARCGRSSRRHRRLRGARCRHTGHRAPAQHPAAGLPGSGTSGAVTNADPSAAPGGATGTPSSTITTPTPEGGETSTTGTPPPSVPHVQVTAVEYSFTLSRTTVPAGKVVLQFVNHGQDEHNLNVLPQEGELAGQIPNTASEHVVNQEVELRPGTYTLFCTLPEHEKKGMKATLTVE